MSDATKNVKTVQETADAKKRREEKRKRELELRSDPRKLAAAIAEAIRQDDFANEDPHDYQNGGVMHWYQEAWGNVRARAGSFLKLTKPLTYEDSGRDWFEVTCPTTGCIAGWADQLAGYPLCFKEKVYETDFQRLKQENPEATEVDVVLENYGNEEYNLITVDYCYDGDRQEIRGIADVAEELLNLGANEREYLFHGDRKKEEVLFVLDKIAAGEDWWDDVSGYNIEDGDEYEHQEDYDAEEIDA